LPPDCASDRAVRTTVRKFVKMAFEEAGIKIEFSEEGKAEKGVIKSCKNEKYQLPIGKEVVAIDPNYFRLTEVGMPIRDATKTNEKLGWKPKYTLAEMIKEMVVSDLETYKISQERKYFM